MRASSESGASALLQFSHVGLSSSMALLYDGCQFRKFANMRLQLYVHVADFKALRLDRNLRKIQRFVLENRNSKFVK